MSASIVPGGEQGRPLDAPSGFQAALLFLGLLAAAAIYSLGYPALAAVAVVLGYGAWLLARAMAPRGVLRGLRERGYDWVDAGAARRYAQHGRVPPEQLPAPGDIATLPCYREGDIDSLIEISRMWRQAQTCCDVTAPGEGVQEPR